MIRKGRLEAFTYGVIAIIITIMVLELKVPHRASVEALVPLMPVFVSYILSFIYIGIYCNNHHHMIRAVKSVNGKILWSNVYLLFWMSMVPFVTAWMVENHFAMWPVVFYGVALLMAAIAYTILTITLVSHHGKNSLLAKATGRDWKGIAHSDLCDRYCIIFCQCLARNYSLRNSRSSMVDSGYKN